jgi:hypothetical protein
MDEDARRLSQFCNERVGDDLRTVITYDTSDESVIHLREDLKTEYSQAELGPLVDEVRSIHDTYQNVAGTGTKIGSPRASVHVFDNSVVMQLLYDANSGIIVSFEPSVAKDMLTFIGSCLKQIQPKEPSTVER